MDTDTLLTIIICILAGILYEIIKLRRMASFWGGMVFQANDVGSMSWMKSFNHDTGHIEWLKTEKQLHQDFRKELGLKWWQV